MIIRRAFLSGGSADPGSPDRAPYRVLDGDRVATDRNRSLVPRRGTKPYPVDATSSAGPRPAPDYDALPNVGRCDLVIDDLRDGSENCRHRTAADLGPHPWHGSDVEEWIPSASSAVARSCSRRTPPEDPETEGAHVCDTPTRRSPRYLLRCCLRRHRGLAAAKCGIASVARRAPLVARVWRATSAEKSSGAGAVFAAAPKTTRPSDREQLSPTFAWWPAYSLGFRRRLSHPERADP